MLDFSNKRQVNKTCSYISRRIAAKDVAKTEIRLTEDAIEDESHAQHPEDVEDDHQKGLSVKN